MRVAGRLGVRTLILTNAAGGINLSFKPGTLMLMDDHINLLGSNPLVGPNDERFGPRFPDMTEVYSQRLRDDRRSRPPRRSGSRWREASTSRCTGRATRRRPRSAFLRTIGADAVGMSTVPEAIVARHMGLEVLGISCITNPAAGVLPQPLVHDEVMEVARPRARRSSRRCWRRSLSESDSGRWPQRERRGGGPAQRPPIGGPPRSPASRRRGRTPARLAPLGQGSPRRTGVGAVPLETDARRRSRRRKGCWRRRARRASSRRRSTRSSRSAPRSRRSTAPIITGCNIENATYGLTLCAERVALVKALSEGHTVFTRIAVVADTDAPTPPCGPCRQLLWEYCGDIEVVLGNLRAAAGHHRLSALLPLPFDRRLL